MLCIQYVARADRTRIRKFRHNLLTQNEEKQAPPRNLRSEFMITLPEREMLYVTRIFNGQYLMAVKPAPLASRPYDSSFGAARGHKRRKRSFHAPFPPFPFRRPLFVAVNLPRIFQFRYLRTCIDAFAARIRSILP